MAKQEKSKDAVPASPADTTPVEGGTPDAPEATTPVQLTSAQKKAAALKAILKENSEAENAAYEAEKAKEEAKEKAKQPEESEFIDEKDYTAHNKLGQKLKEKLAAEKA